ncbi:MAG: transglutaminase-like domain-containing protein [Pseudobdellovibrionaceae bacterium]
MNMRAELAKLGNLDQNAIPLFETALWFAALGHPGRGLDPYRTHLKNLVQKLEKKHQDACAAGADDTPEERVKSLRSVMFDDESYSGDSDNYNDLRNADMMEVIDRRKGMPIALALLAIELGRAQGWGVQGISFPGHFLVRMDGDGVRLMCDPFDKLKILQAPDLRALLKKVFGEKAELSSTYYVEASNRDILLRLQNNIKFRQIEDEEYQSALATIENMRLIAPDEYRLLLDDGVVKARLGRVSEAIESVRGYIHKVPDMRYRAEAESFLLSLEQSSDR